MRGKSFLCWIGRNNKTSVHIGDEIEFQPAGSEEWLVGKVGCKRDGGYVVRIGSKEHILWMRTQLRCRNDPKTEN